MNTANASTTLSGMPTGWAVLTSDTGTTGGSPSSNDWLNHDYLIQSAAGTVAWSATASTSAAYGAVTIALKAG
jgi:hypothetical protein